MKKQTKMLLIGMTVFAVGMSGAMALEEQEDVSQPCQNYVDDNQDGVCDKREDRPTQDNCPNQGCHHQQQKQLGHRRRHAH